jgi:hypothetical protein
MLHRLAESIPVLLKRLQIRAQDLGLAMLPIVRPPTHILLTTEEKFVCRTKILCKQFYNKLRYLTESKKLDKVEKK